MKQFYLNKDFFYNYLGCYYGLSSDFYLHIIYGKVLTKSYKKTYGFIVEFCVKFDNEMIPVFKGVVTLTNCSIVLSHIKYLLESPAKSALFKQLPVTPAWNIPATNYLTWLRRCYTSLCVYRNEDWI